MLRGIAVAASLALTHVASAVILALLAAPLVTRTLAGAGRAPTLETLSRSMLVLIGLWLLFRAVRGGARHSGNEGIVVGVTAGLIPCPLTLFVMFFAMGRGVTEAGLTFAIAMVLGIAITLGTVAAITVFARQWLVAVIARHGVSLQKVSRMLDAAAGLLLIAIALHELLG